MPSIESSIEDIRELIEYNWDSELGDYQEGHAGSGNRNGMFPLLVRLRSWLDGTDVKPTSFLEMPEGLTDAMLEAAEAALGREVMAYELEEWLDDAHGRDDDELRRVIAIREQVVVSGGSDEAKELAREVDGLQAVLAVRAAERKALMTGPPAA